MTMTKSQLMVKGVDVTHLMGQKVQVYWELRRKTSSKDGRHYYPRKVEWVNERVGTKGWGGRAGWVTGIRWVQAGVVEGGYDEPSQFIGDGHAIPVLLVTYWPTMKPVKVPLVGDEAMSYNGEEVGFAFGKACSALMSPSRFLQYERESRKARAAKEARDDHDQT